MSGQGSSSQTWTGKDSPARIWGGRERLARRPSLPAAKRPPGAVTLRSSQFTFGCFQSIKAPCLEMRVLADLASSVEFKGLCNSLVWNRVWAQKRENAGTHECSFQSLCLWETEAASSRLHHCRQPQILKSTSGEGWAVEGMGILCHRGPCLA